MIFSEEVIKSRSNPSVKLYATLKDKKGRDNESLFLAEGEKLTYEAIEAGLPVVKILVCESKSDKIIPKLRGLADKNLGANACVQVLGDDAFLKISTENAPQGVISVIKHLDFFRQLDIIYKEEFSQNACGRSIVLSSIRDPGNLGSVIRSAVAFGVEHIILSADCADIYNPKTIRSTMGSVYRMPFIYTEDLLEVMKQLQEKNVKL